jgi:hypothetical protein
MAAAVCKLTNFYRKIHVENAPECPFVVEWLESNNGGKQLLPISNRAVSTVMSETPKSRASRRQSTSPHRTADSSAAGVTPQPQPSKKRKLQRNDKVTNAADSVFKKTTAQEATEISNAGDYVMTSALAFLPGKTADLFNQQFALIERIINELNGKHS